MSGQCEDLPHPETTQQHPPLISLPEDRPRLVSSACGSAIACSVSGIPTPPNLRSSNFQPPTHPTQHQASYQLPHVKLVHCRRGLETCRYAFSSRQAPVLWFIWSFSLSLYSEGRKAEAGQELRRGQKPGSSHGDGYKSTCASLHLGNYSSIAECPSKLFS